LQIVHHNRVENVNRVQLSGCHEYTGQSHLVDEAAPAAIAPAAPAVNVANVPLGAMLELALQTPIDFATSAIGDPLTFELKNSVKAGGQVLFSKGAVAHGRLTMLRHLERSDGEGYVVGIRLLSVEAEGKRAAVNAALRFNAFAGDEQAQRRGRYLLAPGTLPGDLGSVFFQYGDEFHMKKGATMRWHTIPPQRDSKPQ